MKRRHAIVVAVLALLGVFLATVAIRDRRDAEPSGRPNVILLTIDTLRPDHLGAYGYPRPTSPSLDRLAGESVVFEDTVSSSAWTSPGLVSLLTGLFAQRHGVTGPAASVTPGTPTMATLLRQAAYQVPNIVYLTSIPNYANLGFGPADMEFFGGAPGDELLRWIDRAPSEPFFVWYHYRYVHLPFDASPEQVAPFWAGSEPAIGANASEGLRAVHENVIVPRDSVRFDLPGDRSRVVALYDAEVRQMDAWLGRVIELLEARGVLDRSLLVLSADHGEELFDHGWLGHASTTLHATLHEELIRIPLLMRFPGGTHAGTRVSDPVRGVDVLPTVLGLLRIEPPANLDGRDLMPLIRGEPLPAAPAILESAIAGYQTPPDRTGERLAGIRSRGWKLVMGRDVASNALYDLATDPRELTNLAGTANAKEAELRQELVAFLAQHDPGFFVGDVVEATPTQTIPDGTPCPEIEEPADGTTLEFAKNGGVIHARWKGNPKLHYVLEYEIGEGRFRTVNHMPVPKPGNEQDFGPFPLGVWQSFRDFNPWRVWVTLPGQHGCEPQPIEIRF